MLEVAPSRSDHEFSEKLSIFRYFLIEKHLDVVAQQVRKHLQKLEHKDVNRVFAHEIQVLFVALYSETRSVAGWKRTSYLLIRATGPIVCVHPSNVIYVMSVGSLSRDSQLLLCSAGQILDKLIKPGKYGSSSSSIEIHKRRLVDL